MMGTETGNFGQSYVLYVGAMGPAFKADSWDDYDERTQVDKDCYRSKASLTDLVKHVRFRGC